MGKLYENLIKTFQNILIFSSSQALGNYLIPTKSLIFATEGHFVGKLFKISWLIETSLKWFLFTWAYKLVYIVLFMWECNFESVHCRKKSIKNSEEILNVCLAAWIHIGREKRFRYFDVTFAEYDLRCLFLIMLLLILFRCYYCSNGTPNLRNYKIVVANIFCRLVFVRLFCLLDRASDLNFRYS